MKKYVVYLANNGKYEVNKFDALENAHNKFNEQMIEAKYTYLELGIDKVDIDGTYTIVRKLYN